MLVSRARASSRSTRSPALYSAFPSVAVNAEKRGLSTINGEKRSPGTINGEKRGPGTINAGAAFPGTPRRFLTIDYSP